MFVFLGKENGSYLVFDSDDRKVGHYTKEEIDYAISVGAEIKYYDSELGYFEYGINTVDGSPASAYPILVFIVHLYGGNVDLRTHQYHIYNLQTNTTTILTHVPFQHRQVSVDMTKITYKEGVYYYEFEGTKEVTGAIKQKLLGSTLRIRNTGSIKEGYEWEPWEFDNFVRVTD